MKTELAESSWYANADTFSSDETEPERPIIEKQAPMAEPAPQENIRHPAVIDLLRAGNQPEAQLVRARPSSGPTSQFKALQLFEGTVSEVRGDTFEARLRDQLSSDEPLQRATLPAELVWESERELICPGAVFYWSIGYRIKPHGERRLESTIRFRRLPAWSERDLAHVRAVAEELSGFLAED